MLYLNNVALCGRITKDLELRTTPTGTAYTKFTVAVERERFDSAAEKVSDFINVLAWSKTAEFICKYFAKGSAIYVEGSIQTGSYTNKDNVTVYTTEVNARKAKFAESKPNSNSPAARNEQPNYYQPQNNGYQNNYPQANNGGFPQQQNQQMPDFEVIIGNENVPF